MDAPLRLLLERAYGYAKRQNKARGPLSADERATCEAAGYPLKQKTKIAHDDAVQRLRAAAAKLTPEAVTDAFVAHVGGSFGPGGQALIVYAYTRHLEPHEATYQPGYTTCQICGLDRQASVDTTERALRAELGWLWNERDSEWATDLEHVAAHPLPKASQADRETFQALLALIASGPADEKPSQLEKRIAASKLLPHTEKYRRYGICEALGEVGVMPNALVKPSWDAFTTVADLWAASRKAKGGPRSDVVLPFGAWRGELGVDWSRAKVLFGVKRPSAPVLGKRMASFWMTFRECGFAAWGILFASILASGFGLLAAVLSLARIRAAKVIAGVAFVLALSPLFFGAVGMLYGRHVVEAALSGESVDPAQKARIMQEGYREAGGCVPLGLGFSVLPFLLAGSAVMIAVAFPKKPEVSAEV